MRHLRGTMSLACLLSAACLGQTVDLDRQLASGSPRDVAWAAYTIGVQKRVDMVPSLVNLVNTFDAAATVDHPPVPPEAAVMETAADALIRLDAKLPADVIMHLYPRFPAQTIILLSRGSANSGPLLDIFQRTKSRELWLAAGNLLAVHPPPGFARTLLDGAVTTFSFRVVSNQAQATSPSGGGCASDFYMTQDENFRDWPKARLYRIVTGENAPDIFAPGIHPVGFSWWETTNYFDSWQDTDCAAWTSRYWRTGLMAQLLNEKMSDFPLRPSVNETVLFTSNAAFEQHVEGILENTSEKFGEVIEALVQRGVLAVEDSAALHLQCRVDVVDDRRVPHDVLPQIATKWCVAPPVDADSRLP